MRGLIEDGAREMHMRARVYSGKPRPQACAQIEQNPRQGVELFDTCDAPTTPISFLELLICDLVTIGALLLAVWAVSERVQEFVR